MWLPVLIGASIGFMFGRLIGAVVGGWLGYWLARQLSGMAVLQSGTPIQVQFTESTFAVMGCLCKADGQVDQREIAVAEAFMRRLKLDEAQRGDAILAFNRGKKSGFDLHAEVTKLKAAARGNVQLLRMFMEVQLQAVLADGQVTDAERSMLLQAAASLGLSGVEVKRLDAALRWATRGQAGGFSGAGAPPSRSELDDAYAVLGVSASDSDAEIKKAYRKLMAEHHPDRLAAKGLPESMRDVAEQKTRDITRAYDTVKQQRKSR